MTAKEVRFGLNAFDGSAVIEKHIPATWALTRLSSSEDFGEKLMGFFTVVVFFFFFFTIFSVLAVLTKYIHPLQLD